MYNAHLEVVHSSITAAMEQTSARDGITGNGEGKGKGKGKGKSKVESNGVKPNRERYKQVNPVEETSVSDAVRTAFNERVSVASVLATRKHRLTRARSTQCLRMMPSLRPL